MQKYNVLVLDDDPGVLDTYRHIFSKFPYITPHPAQNRLQAQAILKDFRLPRKQQATRHELIALAFIDQKLNDFDPVHWHDDVEGAEGLAIIPYIKQVICPLTRIAMVTAFAGTAEDRGFFAGRHRADAYVGKGEGAGLGPKLHALIPGELRAFDTNIEDYNAGLALNLRKGD